MTLSETIDTPVPIDTKTARIKRLEKWIDIEARRFLPKPMTVRGNPKNQDNTIEPVYGCRGGSTNDGHGCWWGCYAKFTAKRLPVDFDVPVPQTLDEDILWPQLKKVRTGWLRIGVIGEPAECWTDEDGHGGTVGACELTNRARLVPVVFTRQWEIPSKDELLRLYESNTVIHGTICAYDSKEFLRPRVNMAKRYLQLGGRWVWRVVTFHFDGTTSEGERLWQRQDHLMTGALGSTSDRRALPLETPARMMKGPKQRNPTWDRHVPEWAYFKSPTTKDHKFSAHNHNWTAGVLYHGKYNACWVGCRRCTVQCEYSENRESYVQMTLE